MTKTCKRCQTEKPLTEFQLQKKSGYYNSNCRICAVEYQKDYKANYPHKIKERSASYYERNKERMKEEALKRYHQNKNKDNE